MAITPPEQRVWWNEPVEKTEVLWVTIALVWALVMFFMMPYWHFAGEQNLSNEAYRVKPDAYLAKVEASAEKHKVREEGTTGIPVVRPPVGGDAYLLGRQFQWWPVLELKKGATYRLHMSSMDVQHGFSLLPENINIQVHPEYEMILKVTPTRSGSYGILCNEYCGTGHHIMTGKIYVTDN
ncbi:MAG: cytochrome c oxidase subunit II [Magnetospirillum sp. WYHS-4]